MSAMAFSEGLLNGKGILGTCKSQPVYIWSLPAVKFFFPSVKSFLFKSVNTLHNPFIGAKYCDAYVVGM